MSSDLHFDEKKVDVGKAEEYLKNKKEYHSIGCEDSGIIEYDAFNNKVFLSSSNTLQCTSSQLSEADLSEKFINLAESVLENINLLSQLEYLIRKVPQEETRDVEIKLLVQNLIYRSSLGNREETSSSSDLYMHGDIPLSTLGLIAVTKQENFTIFSTKETAAVCSLFVELCRRVGLNYVYLVYRPISDVPSAANKDLFFAEDFRPGCVGVVTERADIDSAIDTFLYSTSRFPWNIVTIYVQESILEQFKKRIEWKTKEPSNDLDQSVVKSCSSVRVYEDKMYLFEFAGNIKKISQNSVIIDAYRTSKELISFMSAVKTLGVSLWSSDVAESNEIAFNIKANIVWINDFGRFDGPPAASQAFYSSIVHTDEPYTLGSEIMKMRMSWMKMDETERYFKVLKVIRSIEADISVKKDRHYVWDICLEFPRNSTTSIGSRMCSVLRSPLWLYVNVKSLEDLLKHMNFILQGSQVGFAVEKSLDYDAIIKYCKFLQSIGAPVAFMTAVDGFKSQIRYETKVIWSSIGTIFAN